MRAAEQLGEADYVHLDQPKGQALLAKVTCASTAMTFINNSWRAISLTPIRA